MYYVPRFESADYDYLYLSRCRICSARGSGSRPDRTLRPRVGPLVYKQKGSSVHVPAEPYDSLNGSDFTCSVLVAASFVQVKDSEFKFSEEFWGQDTYVIMSRKAFPGTGSPQTYNI